MIHSKTLLIDHLPCWFVPGNSCCSNEYISHDKGTRTPLSSLVRSLADDPRYLGVVCKRHPLYYWTTAPEPFQPIDWSTRLLSLAGDRLDDMIWRHTPKASYQYEGLYRDSSRESTYQGFPWVGSPWLCRCIKETARVRSSITTVGGWSSPPPTPPVRRESPDWGRSSSVSCL